MSVKSENFMMDPQTFSSEEETLESRLRIIKVESLNPCGSQEQLNISPSSSQRLQTVKAEPPEPNCVSVKSEDSTFLPPDFNNERTVSDLRLQIIKAEPLEPCVYEQEILNASSSSPQRLQIIKAEAPEPRCVSVKSENSTFLPPEISNERTSSVMRLQTVKAEPQEPQQQQLNVSPSSPQRLQTIKSEPLEPSGVSVKRENPVSSDLSSGRDVLPQNQSRCGMCEQVQADPVSITCGHTFCKQCFKSLWDQSFHSRSLTCPCCRKRFKICYVQHPPKEEPMELDEGTDVLLSIPERNKISLKNKYKKLFEGLRTQGNKLLFRTVYTQLYIIEGEREGVNEEHEVSHIENKPWKQHLPYTPIHFLDIFNPAPCTMGEMEEDNIRAVTVEEDMKHEETKEEIYPQVEKPKSVLTKGIAGIGKTVSVQKFILDWAEGKANQDIEFMFVLPFRELNLIKGKKSSLHGLLCTLHPALRGLDARQYNMCKTMFIFDGLDESRIPLKFSECEKVSEVTKVSSVAALVTNLIRGDLLPSAHIWITSRPAAANQIPSQYISRVTEIQGFNDPQKEEYFRKRISDQHQANSVISHMNTTRSLHIMCHIPVFCWISANVLQRIMKQGATEIPKTLTAMYSHFLCTQTFMRNVKYEEGDQGSALQEQVRSNRNMFLKLSKLAFKQLMKGNVVFYEGDLRECGIDVTEASVYSGICTEIFREESVLYQRKVYCFVHLSFQEFLAAFYVFQSYVSNNMEELHVLKLGKTMQSDSVSLDELLKGAVRTALKSKNGYLDLFLRFLVGISLESNQQLLQDLLTHTVSSSESIKKTIQYIERMIQTDDLPSERSSNLLFCLTEMNHCFVSSKIQERLKSQKRSNKRLSTGDCLVLAYMLVNSDEVLDELDLRNYNTTEKGHWRLIPAVRNCRKAVLPHCNLSMNSCETLYSALKSPNSLLKELEFSKTHLQDSGVKLICEALKSSNCKLETLRFSGCDLSINSYESLCSALKSINSPLKVLELSNTDLQDSGVKLISETLNCSDCKLETLRLTDCKFTLNSYVTLSSVFKSLNSPKELDPSDTDLHNSGLRLVSEGNKTSGCTLEIIRLNGYKLTMNSFEVHFSALKSPNSSLKELDLSDTELQESEVKLISDGLNSLTVQLEVLRFCGCKLSMNSYKTIHCALKSSNSSLKELDLRNTELQDSGVELISEALKSSNCKLETLRLTDCKFTLNCYETLCSALKSEGNKNSECKLEIIRLNGYKLTMNSCEVHFSALKSPNSSLKELNLSNIELQESEVKLISDGLKNSNCQMEILRLTMCELGEKSCEDLGSVLLEYSSLKEMDLSNNDLQDSGVEKLCAGLKSSHCKLETLRLSGCMVTEKGCAFLASALCSNPSHLKELDLSYNHPGDTGVKLLSVKLKDPNCRLNTLRLEQAGVFRIKPGLKKYACELTLDPNTVNTRLSLSEGNRKAERVKEKQTYPGHPDRFSYWQQVMCRESLTGRCYWETEWSGEVNISVAYKSIRRKGVSFDCLFGANEKSWNLECSSNCYSVLHDKDRTSIPPPPYSSNRAGVYVDYEAGTLSFYSVSTDTHTLSHLYTLQITFMEPLNVGFTLWCSESSVTLCEIK
ncbi:NLR family CARD domain-containing protein 3-like [Hoplias malabaricus]|uniref:NLR family CARD domain-containing protein 3-like n=1 Tax=Hoplias malabaricus TaxID=27720 RepID=UPI003462CC4E